MNCSMTMAQAGHSEAYESQETPKNNRCCLQKQSASLDDIQAVKLDDWFQYQYESLMRGRKTLTNWPNWPTTGLVALPTRSRNTPWSATSGLYDSQWSPQYY